MSGTNAMAEIGGMTTMIRNMTAAASACEGAFLKMQTAASQAASAASFDVCQGSMAQLSIGAAAFGQEISKGSGMLDKFQGKLKGIAASFLNIDNAKKVLNLSDEMSQASAKLNMINDGLKSSQELEDMVYASAQRSGTAYGVTADIVARLGASAGNVFSGSTEVIAFAENLSKSFSVAGASQQEMQSASMQLAQALETGAVSGEELNGIFQSAPNVLQTIADYMGMPVEGIMNMADQGLLTADIVKNAMLSATDDINADFNSMPLTWSQVGNKLQNSALKAFEPVLDTIGKLTQDKSFETLINGIGGGLQMLASIAAPVLDILVGAASLIVDNWSMIAPILLGVAAAVLIYQAAVHGTQLVTQAAAAAAEAWGAAQKVLNIVMTMNPLGLVLLAIVLIIAAVYAIVAAINEFTGSSYSATGIICGAFAVLGSFMLNMILSAVEGIVGIIQYLVNPFIQFGNFLANVWTNPVSSVIYLFQGMADTVLGLLESVAKAMDAVLGTDMAGTVSGWRAELKGMAEAAVLKYAPEENYEKAVEELDIKLEDYGIEAFNYQKSAEKGYRTGDGIDASVGGFFKGGSTAEDYAKGLENYAAKGTGSYAVQEPGGPAAGSLYSTAAEGEIAASMGETAENTGAVADCMEISEEDLQYLRDIAERDIIDRTVFSSINVDMGGVNNTVNNLSDLDGIAQSLADSIQEQMSMSAEGVH